MKYTDVYTFVNTLNVIGRSNLIIQPSKSIFLFNYFLNSLNLSFFTSLIIRTNVLIFDNYIPLVVFCTILGCMLYTVISKKALNKILYYATILFLKIFKLGSPNQKTSLIFRKFSRPL